MAAGSPAAAGAPGGQQQIGLDHSTSLTSVVSVHLEGAAQSFTSIGLKARSTYDESLVLRLSVWAAAVATAVVFLQSPILNTISIVSALISLSIYAAVALALVAAAAHQIHRSEHAAAVQHINATSPPVVPLPVPQRLPEEQSMTPAEIFTQRWKLPRVVVSQLGALLLETCAEFRTLRSAICSTVGGICWA